MTLKQQIEATIAAYQEACKPENLNYLYCEKNNLEHGICFFSKKHFFIQLSKTLELYFNDDEYLTATPFELLSGCFETFFYVSLQKCETIIDAHKIRIAYLETLLKQCN